MKKFTSILTAALLLTAITAEATGYLTIFKCRRHVFRAHRPGYTQPIAEFDLDFDNDIYGLTYDGDYWWVTDTEDDHIYAFDYGGDLVSNFPSPGPDPLSLAFDGEYLWVCCEVGVGETQVYQVALDGTPGPYGDFTCDGYHGLTFFQGQVLGLNDRIVSFYEPDGTFVREIVLEADQYEVYALGLADDEEYLWAAFDFEDKGMDYIYKYDPETGDRIPGEGGWGGMEALGCAIWSESLIEVESLGKIKAFFTDK